MNKREEKVRKMEKEVTFERLIEECKLAIYKTAKAILKNEDDTCDAIQEALLSAYKSFDTLKEKQYFKTWIIRITVNKSYDIIKRNKRNEEKIINIGRYVTEKEEKDHTEKLDLENALNHLEEELHAITVLYYYDDIEIKDIAEILQIPEGTVKSRLARAREKLYQMLGGEEDGERFIH